MCIRDSGRGIPVGINHKAGIPAVEVVFTILHAGGKFGGGGYKVSGGLHGVGASVVNALSEWLEVRIYSEGKIYYQRYQRGHAVEPLKVIGECALEKTGTQVTFLPDKEKMCIRDSSTGPHLREVLHRNIQTSAA